MLNQYKMPKWKLYSITDKSAVIASVKHGESQASMSSDNDVPESTIHVSWKLCDFADIGNSTDGIKRLRLILNKTIYQWALLNYAL